jgi:hypothetical protein
MKDHYNVLFLCTGNSAFGGARSGRQLHHCCILVHRVHFFRKPCCHGATVYHRHLFMDSASGCTRLRLGPGCGRDDRHAPVPLARPQLVTKVTSHPTISGVELLAEACGNVSGAAVF